MNHSRAKQLFFEYAGSRFYMSRNGVEDEYNLLDVPSDVENQWLKELTDAKLQLLDDRGNWKIVQYLLHHGETRHWSRLRSVSPLGVFWEKCAYLEELLKYLKLCHPLADIAMNSEMCDSLLESADRLKTRVRSSESISRVDQLITSATSFRAELFSR